MLHIWPLSQIGAFPQGLSEADYVEGRRVAIEYCWAEAKIIELENQVDALRSRVAELTEELAVAYAAAEQAAAAAHASYRRDLVPLRQETAIVVWKPKPRRH